METEDEFFNFTSSSKEDEPEIISSCNIDFDTDNINSFLEVSSPSISGENEEKEMSSIGVYDEIFSTQNDIEEVEESNLEDYTSSETEPQAILHESEIFSSICDIEQDLVEPNSEKCSTFEDSLTRKVREVYVDEGGFLETSKKIKLSNSPVEEIEQLNEEKNQLGKEEKNQLGNEEKNQLGNEENIGDLDISGFTTGNKKNILINKQPKFTRTGVGRPARSFLRPEKGHKSSTGDEKTIYIELFNKVSGNLINCERNWLRIQFRWVWIHLNLNDTPLKENELVEHIKIRRSTEYSILRRIVEGDDVSYRYMVLLVIDTGIDFIEGYDGFYSVRISVDKDLQNEIKSKRLQIGTKIKLFGCKLMLESSLSILDLREDQVVMSACYNGFSYASRTRKLGYKKKISFARSINSIKKEGGTISCVIGIVKRVIESKYVVKVKDYRNTVEDIEKEYENIVYLMDKNNEKVEPEDVKVRRYINFILEEGTSECLVTSWMYVDKIKKGQKIMFCGLIPVLKSVGNHLTTTRKTYVKFLS